MSQFRSHLWVGVVVLVSALAVWIGNKASPLPVQVQEVDRVLEIERYPDEPLQIVDVRIGTQSVKDRVKPKFKDNKSKWGIESVKFNEKDDWVKRISFTLRNVSDKPALGLQGLLFFKPVGYTMMFSLQLTTQRQLRNDPLPPGGEIELAVNPGLLTQTLEDAKRQGADLRGAVVSFSLDMVIFSDELRWYRGRFVRPDTAVPNKWVPVDDPLAMKPSSTRVKATSASFMKASFKDNALKDLGETVEVAPVAFATCKFYNNSFQGVSCPGDPVDCIRRTDIDDSPDPGFMSHVTFSGLCVDQRDLGLTCNQSGTHTRMQLDQNCTCPDNDNDGYTAKSCGGGDCRDNNSAINPGAEETDQWIPGGGWDCSLCNDGEDNDCDNDEDDADSDCNPQLCASPVLVDVSGNGLNLTNSSNGVNFDLNSDGTREKLSWTGLHTDDAWLALDRNGDGVINNGTELFGNFTPQPKPPSGYGKNGFNALVEFDGVAKGGNGDGLITEQDSIFSKLWLWQDRNHNGVSEANELNTLKQHGLKVIECDYKESKRKDQQGNLFRYRAKLIDARNTQVGRWAWDVFLVTEKVSFAKGLFRPFEDTNGVNFYEAGGTRN